MEDFYNAGRKFLNGECKELRRIKNSKKLMQVEVVQSPAKKGEESKDDDGEGKITEKVKIKQFYRVPTALTE